MQPPIYSLNSAIRIAIPGNSYTISYGSLASVGWYKFAKSKISKKYASGNVSLISIFRNYNSNASEAYMISLVESYNNFKVNMINSLYNVRLITKIREIYESDSNETFYELYYTGTKSNSIYIYAMFFPFGAIATNIELDNGNPSVLFEYTIP